MLNIFKHSTALMMISVGAVAGMISLTLNISHGLESSIAAAAACGLADAARQSVPVIAAVRGWSKQLQYGIIALGLFSLFNIANYIANSYGETIWNAMQADNGVSARSVKIENLNAKIDAIAEKASVASLEKLADSEKQNGGCKTKCQDFKKRIPEAERREKLEAELKALEDKNANVATVEVKGFALALVAKGYSPIAAKTIMDALNGLLTLLVVDMLVYFLIPGFAWLREDKAKAKLSALGVSTELTVKTRANGTKKISKDEAYRIVCAKLLETSEGSILTSCRQLAELIGVPKTTFTNWMEEWKADDKLIIQPKSKHRALVSLPRKAA